MQMLLLLRLLLLLLLEATLAMPVATAKMMITMRRLR